MDGKLIEQVMINLIDNALKHTTSENEIKVIVRTDKQIRNFINFSLKSQDYNCIEASTGKEAMNIIASQKLSMIILDLGLPDMDGIDIIKQVRSYSDIPIIVVSSRESR